MVDITVPGVHSSGDPGHTDDHNTMRQALLDLETAVTAVESSSGSDSLVWSRSGNAAVVGGAVRWYNPRAGATNLFSARASVNTAPTGASLVVDLVKNGATTIATLTIAAGAYTSGLQTLEAALADGDYLTVNITQVGSTTPGADLTVQVTHDSNGAPFDELQVALTAQVYG